MTEVFAIDVDEIIDSNIFDSLCTMISKERLEKIKRFKFQVDAKRSIYAEILLKYIVYCKLNISQSYVKLKYNLYGKPYLQDIPDFYFNISHSGKWVVCAWSKNEVGVDVESIESADIDIAKRFFNKSEYLQILDKKPADRSRLLIDFWTLKESYIKYKGKGLSISLDSIIFRFEKNKVIYNCHQKEKIFFHRINIDSKHRLALCSEELEFKGLQIVSLKNICEKMFDMKYTER
jgi:4'-phosphopantetheinyl transferase